MSARSYYTDPPKYHDMDIDAETLAMLVDRGSDNQHCFISRDAVKALLRSKKVSAEDKAELKKWLAAYPDADELYFSFDY